MFNKFLINTWYNKSVKSTYLIFNISYLLSLMDFQKEFKGFLFINDNLNY